MIQDWKRVRIEELMISGDRAPRFDDKVDKEMWLMTLRAIFVTYSR